ncbi:hypothetical protein MNBD_NITROSPINAE04-2584 [hydrothermal vent metagenome]|uniref:Uncharacterized protein n=1 Tax=hydrothermal vent metagenome TaxID=652676 RepID=A0A3B1BZT2_9ZZZZ
MAVLEKKQMSGFIQPRWMKAKCVRFWEIGAIPAILGLWFPDFVGQYAHMMAGEANYAFPPVITYVGALFLFAACVHAIEDMGIHFKVATVCGWVMIAFAGLSVVFHFMITPENINIMLALTILCIGLAAYMATTMFYAVIAKAAELGMETRMIMDRNVVLVFNHAAILAGAASVVAIYLQADIWLILLRLCVILFTVAWIACRTAVYFFKTDNSLGVFFTKPPDEQFWV